LLPQKVFNIQNLCGCGKINYPSQITTLKIRYNWMRCTMRALILSVSTGGGHAKAAEAIKESIMKNEPQSEVQIIDTIKYISPFLDKLVVGTYLKSIRYYPSFFKFLYKHSEIESTNESNISIQMKRADSQNHLPSGMIISQINSTLPLLILNQIS